jgi:hypothetical protein
MSVKPLCDRTPAAFGIDERFRSDGGSISARKFALVVMPCEASTPSSFRGDAQALVVRAPVPQPRRLPVGYSEPAAPAGSSSH